MSLALLGLRVAHELAQRGATRAGGRTLGLARWLESVPEVHPPMSPEAMEGIARRWLGSMSARAVAQTRQAGRAKARPSTPIMVSRVERARRWLACVDPAIQGSYGHGNLWRAAIGLVKRFELDEDTALYLLETEYNPRCHPPFKRSELVHKVRDAARARIESGDLLNAPRRHA